jgi:tRNA pseudouridine55 synthase
MDGLLVIDKAAGWTSHDVVARLRRICQQKRIGHTGTLDPDATGILIVCLGFATRLIEYSAGYPKRYVAQLRLGVETDSQDASGAVVARADASHIQEPDLAAVLRNFTGDIEQVPPMVSAVHHKGQRLYEIARRGETVEREPRGVTIYSLEARNFTPGLEPCATLEVACSSGTYIRTLCHDIGGALGVGGHMEALRRTAIGPFVDGLSLEQVEEAAQEGRFNEILLPPEALLPPEWPRIDGTADEVDHVDHGRPIPAADEGDRAAFFSGGMLRAVLKRDGGEWRPEKVRARKNEDR